MKEYIERTAVIPALEDYYKPIDPDRPMTLTLGQIAEVVKNMTAAYVVEVVRCRECTKSTKGGASYVWCHGWGRNTEMPPDGYCSYGQRKEADHD